MASHGKPLLLRRTLVSLVAIVVVLALGLQAFQRLRSLRAKPARRPGGARPPVVRVMDVQERDYREVIRGYGVARAMREATVAAEVGGVVREVSPRLEIGRLLTPPPVAANGTKESGGPVPSDAPPLVRIDDQDLKDGLEQLEAERHQTEAERARLLSSVNLYEEQAAVMERRLGTARTELRRILTLVETETLPESEADRQRLAVFALEQADAELNLRREDAEAQVAVVDARLERIAATKRRALRDLTRTRVHSPYRGRVVARHVEVGDLVAPGTPLFDLVDPTLLEVGIALPASRYGDVHAATIGTEPSAVTLRLGEGGAAVWRGTVTRIAPRIDPGSRTFLAFVEIDDPEGETGIAPGTHLVADVEGALHPAVLPVPREAFVDDLVYVAGPVDGERGAADGMEEAVARARRPAIRTTLIGVALVEPGDGETGLRAGDRVIVSNLEDVAEGSRVRLDTSARDAGETEGAPEAGAR